MFNLRHLIDAPVQKITVIKQRVSVSCSRTLTCVAQWLMDTLTDAGTEVAWVDRIDLPGDLAAVLPTDSCDAGFYFGERVCEFFRYLSLNLCHQRVIFRRGEKRRGGENFITLFSYTQKTFTHTHTHIMETKIHAVSC